MTCKHCQGRGITKHSFYSGDQEEPTVSVAVCSHCKDYDAYYAYVREKYGTPNKDNLVLLKEPECKVLDFMEFKKRKDAEKKNDFHIQNPNT